MLKERKSKTAKVNNTQASSIRELRLNPLNAANRAMIGNTIEPFEKM